jgi:hypothetical protein
MKMTQITSQKFRVTPLHPGGLEPELGGDPRTQSPLGSILETLRRHSLAWFRRHGWQLALLEICNCYRRIRMGRKNGWDTHGLDLALVLASLPTMTFPRSCSETLAYSMCIRTLETDRPYLTASDYELFAQAWFQAGRFFHDSDRIQLRTAAPCSLSSSAAESLRRA